MNNYRFTGRIASFFRATGNAWVTPQVMSETVGTKPKALKDELERQIDFGHVEVQGKRGSLHYRWNPETLYLENAKESR